MAGRKKANRDSERCPNEHDSETPQKMRLHDQDLEASLGYEGSVGWATHEVEEPKKRRLSDNSDLRQAAAATKQQQEEQQQQQQQQQQPQR
ncbi:hypothetical protein ACSSS7_007099 [Eimeria intestinalis]